MSRKTPENPPKQASEAEKRAERRAEALRDNLRRRKAAARTAEVVSPGKPQTGEE